MDVKFKDGVCSFDYMGQKYVIPSELYPLTGKDKADGFDSRSGENITDAGILKIIDSLPLDIGRCYKNSELIYQSLKAAGYHPEYFSGWLFTGAAPPLHHAWVMVETESGMHLIDSTYLKLYDAIQKRIDKESIKTMDEARKMYVELLGKELNRKKRNSDRMIMGKPMNGNLYIGVKSSFRETEQLFLNLMHTKNHPSYLGGMKLGGDSILQNMIRKSL